MKIAFFSETGNNQRYPRDFPNARTECAWAIALDAPMCALDVLPREKFDLGIVIIPKNNPKVNLDFKRKCCDKVAIMQEGPHWYFQDYDIEKQFNYYNTLIDADWVYCHNESDVSYYLGLGCKDVRVMRSLMIPDGLPAKGYSTDKSGIILGGNFVSWYGGFDSYIVAREIGDPITAPSMGRKQPQEDLIEDITYLPYMTWREWINECSKYKVGVHMMRTHAAGTFSLNLSYHATPCIGYRSLDTQDLLHPQTTLEVGDIKGASTILKRLYEDDSFYKECSEQTKELYNKYYTEEAWLKDFKEKNKEFKDM